MEVSAKTLILNFSFHICQAIHLCCLSRLICCALLQQAHEINIGTHLSLLEENSSNQAVGKHYLSCSLIFPWGGLKNVNRVNSTLKFSLLRTLLKTLIKICNIEIFKVNICQIRATRKHSISHGRKTNSRKRITVCSVVWKFALFLDITNAQKPRNALFQMCLWARSQRLVWIRDH